MKSSMQPVNHPDIHTQLRKALHMVGISLPHLSELASSVRLQIEPRVPTAGIFPSGRLVVNPDFAADLNLGELTFVLAHELLHLALKTHERGQTSDPALVNYAHDFIINDMLVHDLGRPVPAGGLVRPNARLESLEKLVAELDKQREFLPPHVWDNDPALVDPYGQPARNNEDLQGDALSAELERQWYPDANAAAQQQQSQRVQQAAAQAAVLGQLLDDSQAETSHTPGLQQTGQQELWTDAVKLSYRPPWEHVMQRWFEAVSTRSRSFARPSRRGQRSDVVLPGRVREGWTLHIVLDCSGSMFYDLPKALGAIAAFCEGVGIEIIHLLQCDVAVTNDEWLTPEQLAHYPLNGLGGTDMTPALQKLADDPEVEAVLVLTDEDVMWAPRIDFEPPYDLLWVLMRPVAGFQPPFGSVMSLDLTAPADWY